MGLWINSELSKDQGNGELILFKFNELYPSSKLLSTI
jgi:hypothetical protein